MAATGFFFALFMGVVIAVVGLLLLTPLSVALGSTPTILPYTEKYLGIILIGAPFMTASLVLNNQMRFQGSRLCHGGYRHRCGSEHRVGPVTDFHFRNGDIGSGISYHHQPDVQFLTATVYGTAGEIISSSDTSISPLPGDFSKRLSTEEPLPSFVRDWHRDLLSY